MASGDSFWGHLPGLDTCASLLFGLTKNIYVFMPTGAEGKKKFQSKRACIVLPFYHLKLKFNSNLYDSGYHELCIILTKGIVIFRN